MSEELLRWLASEWVVVAGLLVAGSLAALWWLRGAPVGQAAEKEVDPDAPPPALRDRLAAMVVVGLVAVGLGAYLALRHSLIAGMAGFGIGFAALIGAGKAAGPHRRASPGVRRVGWLADAALNGSLLAGVLIVGNLIAYRYGGRPIDLSSDGAYRLQSMTIGQLKSLDRPLRFVVYAGGGERAVGQVERIRQLLRLFQGERPDLVRVEFVDPYADPARAKELADRVPGIPLSQGGGVLVEYGEGEATRRVVVRNAEMFQAAASTATQVRTEFSGESALATAVIGLARDHRPLIGFTTGHGEPSVTTAEPGARGLGSLRQRLEAAGMRVAPVNPAQELPDELSLLVVAAPESPLSTEDAARVGAFFDRGGRLMVFADAGHPTGLEAWLEARGVTIGPGLVVDPSLNFRGRPELLLVTMEGGSGAHPITAALAGQTLLAPFASPLEARTGARSPAGLLVAPVIRSGVRSWAERSPAALLEFDPEVDAPGPIAVGASVSDLPRPDQPGSVLTPRLVVFSSRELADNRTAAAAAINLDLVVNAVGWLERREDLSGIAPAAHVARVLQAGPNLRVKLVVLPTLLAVFVLMGLGLATYFARRE